MDSSAPSNKWISILNHSDNWKNHFIAHTLAEAKSYLNNMNMWYPPKRIKGGFLLEEISTWELAKFRRSSKRKKIIVSKWFLMIILEQLNYLNKNEIQNIINLMFLLWFLIKYQISIIFYLSNLLTLLILFLRRFVW